MMRIIIFAAVLTAIPLPGAPDSPPQQGLREQLPAYSPAEHDHTVEEDKVRAALRASAKDAGEADPDMVILPAMTVEARAVQRIEEYSQYRKGDRDQHLVKREYSAFERCFLDRFTVPFIGVSKETRARDAYLARKNAEAQERMGRLARLVELDNAAEGREFRYVLRDASLDNRNSIKDAARSTSAKGDAGGPRLPKGCLAAKSRIGVAGETCVHPRRRETSPTFEQASRAPRITRRARRRCEKLRTEVASTPQRA